jgi:hypothetical protein
MEDREQDHRCRRAAWAITWGAAISTCLIAWDLVLHDFDMLEGYLAVPLLLLATRRSVRLGRHLGGMTFLLGYVTLALVGQLGSVRSGTVSLQGRLPGWLAGFAAAQFLLSAVAASFTWMAWRHQVRASRPERSEAEMAFHRGLARQVLIAGLVAVVGLVAAGITVWQETGSQRDALLSILIAAFTLIGTQVLVKRTEQGEGVARTTGLLLPAIILAPAGAIAGLIVLPFGSQSWILAATWLVVSSMAIVISIRALTGGGSRGRRDAD